ncbi:MAG: AAA family ATPase [Firmicutes bacterium]|nr:AAA family ATPase [Bacillota bacterium]
MNHISHLKISGYKRLFNIDLEMRPLMVMIGANGIGKTSMLEVLSLLSASAGGKLNQKLSSLGGISEVVTKDLNTQTESGKQISLSLEIPHKDFPNLNYDLKLEQQGFSYAISSEILCQQWPQNTQQSIYINSAYNSISYYEPNTNSFRVPNWNFNLSETTLSQIPKIYDQLEVISKILSSASLYHTLNVNAGSPVKLPQQLKPILFPGENGEDLFPFLYSMKESYPDRYEIIMDTLKTAFPGFESLGFPPVAAGMLSMTWKEEHFKSPLYMNQLSEGILRFLWLTALLQSPSLPAITMIDEPEVSLHPELLSLLAHQLREASRRTQLIVATHSDRLIRFLKPEEIVVVNMNEDGFAEMEWADALDLEEWLKEYSLDELWNMGRLGGKP